MLFIIERKGSIICCKLENRICWRHCPLVHCQRAVAGQGRHSPSGAVSMDEPQRFHPRPGALRLIPSTAYGLRLSNGTCGPSLCRPWKRLPGLRLPQKAPRASWAWGGPPLGTDDGALSVQASTAAPSPSPCRLSPPQRRRRPCRPPSA
jgi:hypothetical protein